MHNLHLQQYFFMHLVKNLHILALSWQDFPHVTAKHSKYACAEAPRKVGQSQLLSLLASSLQV